MQNFRNLSVWGKARHFTVEVYQSTERFPRTENVRPDKPVAAGILIYCD
jgi:hypothetical protein